MTETKSKIFIEKNSLQQFSKFISSHTFSSLFILVDENTVKHCYPKLIQLLPSHHIVQIEAGEECKTISACETIWQKLTSENADRNSLLINLGGGVVGDMGGFAAGCYKRGIKFINIPTTLLSMVDASVGGKTGIDFMNFKNQIGLFNEPEAVFIDTGFLQTLSERELLSGFAEVIKHYLIADKNLFEEIRNQKSEIRNLAWNEVVAKNVSIKAKIVEQDPHEKNIRKALNFGHTIGHAVESYFLKDENKKLLHGEAVAAGMIAESFLSVKLNLLSEEELNSIAKLILHYFKLPIVPEADFKTILELMKQDKKNVSQKTQFSLLNGIGNYSINNSVEEDAIIDSLRYYNSLLS